VWLYVPRWLSLWSQMIILFEFYFLNALPVPPSEIIRTLNHVLFYVNLSGLKWTHKGRSYWSGSSLLWYCSLGCQQSVSGFCLLPHSHCLLQLTSNQLVQKYKMRTRQTSQEKDRRAWRLFQKTRCHAIPHAV